MRLLGIKIVRFRRFNDLTIEGIPTTAKLVVIVGPNGSGKSSFFDALLVRYRFDAQFGNTRFGWNDEVSYYNRTEDQSHFPITDLGTRITITTDTDGPLSRGSMYFRTAYRNDHDIPSRTIINNQPILGDFPFQRMTEADATIGINYQRLAAEALETVLFNGGANQTLGHYRDELLSKIKIPLERIFPELIFSGMGNPFQDGAFLFDKGHSKGINFHNISAGEKAVFGLLLDIVMKKAAFSHAIYCIDEPEIHMNSSVQAALLQEIVQLIPETSQLWIASHSIGMMRKAREMYEADPDSVAFVDFGGHDFDEVVTLSPTKPTRIFWEKVMHVALGDMAALVAPKQIVVCEGNPPGVALGKNAEHDARIYNAIFCDEFPDTMFISGGNSKEIQNDFIGLATVLPKIVAGINVIRLIDRDDHAPADVEEKQRQGIRTLSRRHIESYLYDDEVLSALCGSMGKPQIAYALIAAKQGAIGKLIEQNIASDDMKKVAGTIYNEAKKLLSLTQAGNDAPAFARHTLAPLVRPGMDVYAQLKHDIFGNRKS